ncbi:hypothetical protein GE061_016069, partial [Apolygus lucorum]
PLPPLTPCHTNLEDKSETEDEDESSDSESEDGASSSDSDSHSQQGSGSCRSSSYTDSDSSSSSSEPRDPVPSFSIRETNFEQGGLKLKFSATKTKSNPSQSSSSSDSSSSSSESEEEPKKKPEEEKKSPEAVTFQRKSVRTAVTSRATKVSESPVEVKGRVGSLPRRSASLRPPLPKPVATQKKKQSKPVKKTRPLRKSPRAKRGVTAGGESSSQLSSDDDDDEDEEEEGGGECRDEITNLARQLGAEDPDLSISGHLQEINQEDLAAILPDVGGGSFDGFEEENNGGNGSGAATGRPQVSSPAPSHITSSSSESDTEQIVSDVISRIQDDSEPTNKPSRPSQQASKSAEHQINRNEIGYSSNLLADFVEKTELLSRGTSSSSSSTGPRGNENSSGPTSAVDSSASKRKRGRPPKNTVKSAAASCKSQNQVSGMPELEAYMRLDCPQSNVSPDSGIQSVAGSPAGHHSLPGSPRSPPPNQNNGPPLLTKAHSPCHIQDCIPSPNDKITKLVSPPKELKLENGGKRGPGRPKSHVFQLNTFGRKKRGKRIKRVELPKKPIVLPPSAAELKVPPYFAGAKTSKSNLPSLPRMSSKRGRGRPKKSPPVLEPIAPLERRIRDASDSSRKCSSLERVPSETSTNKRLDSDNKIPSSTTTKGLLRSKEHKHKKRKRSLDFRKLDPAFLKELTRLSETFEKLCVISYPEPKPNITVSLETKTNFAQRSSKRNVRRRRRRREKLVKQAEIVKSDIADESKSKHDIEKGNKVVNGKVRTPESSPQKEKQVLVSCDKNSSSEKLKKDVEAPNLKKNKVEPDSKQELSKPVSERPESIKKNDVVINRTSISSSHKKDDLPTKSSKEALSKAISSLPTKEKDQQSSAVSSLPKENRSPPVLREKTKERHRKDHAAGLKDKSTLQPASPQTRERPEKGAGKEKSVESLQLKEHRETRHPSPHTAKEPPKDKVNVAQTSKEKSNMVPQKDKTTVAPQKDKTNVAPQKDKTNVAPQKDKTNVAPQKDKTSVAPQKDKTNPTIHSKEKTVVQPVLKEKSVTATSNKEKSTSVVVVKERISGSPSHRDKSIIVPPGKEKPSVIQSVKDKKENVVAQLPKEKAVVASSPVTSPQASAKRRIKKTVIEPPKNKENTEQPNNNEQRLPLKKRHYHMSTSASSCSLSGDLGDKSDESSDSSKEVTESPDESANSSKCTAESKTSSSECVESAEEPNAKENIATTPKKRACVESEKSSKTKEKDQGGKDVVAKRPTLKTATPTVVLTPHSSKRSSSRQAALKHVESQETSKTPPVSPAPVKRSQRIKLKHDDEKNHKEEPSKIIKDDKNLKDSKESANDNDSKTMFKDDLKSVKQEVKNIKDDTKLRSQKPPKTENKMPDISKCATIGEQVAELVANAEEEKKDLHEVPKRTTRSMDEAAEQKINDIMRNDKLKHGMSEKLSGNKHVSTRSSSKASLDAIAATLVENALSKTPRIKCERKSLVGVFEPSNLASDILKLPDPDCDVFNTIKNKLLPDIAFNVEEEMKNIKRPMESLDSSIADAAEKAKKRKVICDVRVRVTKLDPADLPKTSKILNSSETIETTSAVTGEKKVENSAAKPADSPDTLAKTSSSPSKTVAVVATSPKVSPLNGAPSKMKMKRKKFNRTGFPAKKKKKKRLDVNIVVDAAVSTTLVSPPIPQDETKPSAEMETEDEPLPPEARCASVSLQDSVKEEIASATDVSTVVETPTPSTSLPSLSSIEEDDTLEKPATLAEKTELRPASKRIMELKAKNEASERRKRKPGADDAVQSQDEHETIKDGGVSDSSTDLKSLVGKRLRKTKEELDDSDADSVKMRKKQPRWRKKYLPAGLFSDYFKEDEPRKLNGNEKVKSTSTSFNALEHEHGLLPPPAYCAKWVRQRKIPFQLPHDIWWLHVHNQLPGREAVPSWNYKKIRTNVYFDIKPPYNSEGQACNCKPTAESSCGDECINRMVYTECSPQSCPCKEKCSNQKIQRHEWSPGLMRFMTKDKGWGVKTKHSIKKDRFILEYVGEVVSDREFKNRMASRYQKDTHHYCLNLDGGLVIDGHRMGGDGRFVNHSCEPNCEMQKWCVNGLFRMALFALRDIEPNEELTYDYNFSLFNPAEGQPCKCGSSRCRGVIGGKSQRIPVPGAPAPAADEKEKGQVGRPRKNTGGPAPVGHRRKTNSVDKKLPKSSKDQKSGKDILNASALATVAARLSHMTTLKPLTQQQKEFIVTNRIFLTRNLQRVKRRVEKLRQAVKKGGLLLPDVCSAPASPASATAIVSSSTSTSTAAGVSGAAQPNIKKEKEGEREVFMTQLNALNCPRSMRTRRLALAEDNPEMTKAARLACLFKDLYAEVTSAKDESGELLSSHFATLPSKRKFPLYYQRIQKPIDFTTIEQNIVTGEYKTVEAFDEDMNALFKNNIRWYGRTSDLGISATRLRKIYNLAKLDILPKLEELLGETPPASFIPAQDDPSGEEEDVIHCICGIFRDEGLMIQCERCLVWQHCYCVNANSNVENYLCERCSPREVDYEIPSQEEPPAPNQSNYITLLRGDMQLKQGDTVYVLRDIVDEESTEVPKAKHTYKTIKNWKYSDCDIFKIERLWKDEKGKRFAFGHHYLRPHETFHEPTRKFFPNELMRVPLYEVVPVELVMGQCYVLDLKTFCKGRPIGSDPDHLYVCEYRVDKFARMFAKIPKPKHSNVCTKSYAFETFDVKLKPQRTYAPHGMTKEEIAKASAGTGSQPQKQNVSRGRGGRTAQHQVDEVSQAQAVSSSAKAVKPKPILKREDRRERLNKLTLRLLAKLPSKQSPLDLSYLLEPGRRQRKKPPLLAS